MVLKFVLAKILKLKFEVSRYCAAIETALIQRPKMGGCQLAISVK